MAHRRNKDLQRDFESLSTSRDARQRGLEFERLLVKLLHRDGFIAKLNPGTARPRQTDIYARRFDDEFIVEAKWRSRAIDVDGLDSLRTRLSRARPHFTGLLMSMSGFTQEATHQAQEHRAQEVLLFREDEITLLFSGKYDLVDLIKAKRQYLRVHGKVLFSPELAERWITETPDLPQTEEFIETEGKRSHSYRVQAEFVQAVFANAIPEANSRHVYGPVFDLHLGLPIYSPEELRHCLGWLHQRFGLSGEGRFAIEQSQSTWIGCGATEFLAELARRDARYKEADTGYIHHTEYFSYFDEFQDGLLFLHGRNGDHGERSLYSVSLLIRMPGVPIDSRPYQELADLAHQKAAYFVQSKVGMPYLFHCKDGLRVKPLARIINSRFGKEPLVSGLVIENPFYGKEEEVRKLIADEGFDRGGDSPIREIDKCAVLTCGLMGWLSPDEDVKEYYLRSIGVAWGPEGAFVVAAQCFHRKPTNTSEAEPESDAHGPTSQSEESSHTAEESANPIDAE